MISIRHLAVSLVAFVSAASAQAEPTPVKVHVISQDAKFIGDSMGGAEVVLRDAKTGRVLAKGTTKGGTGDTARIMQTSGRSPQRATQDAAHFATTLDLNEPTLVRLEARGPMGKPGKPITVTAERWLIPGRPLSEGDGWTIELPGLAVEWKGSSSLQGYAGQVLTLYANVSLQCGCPITPSGIWDAADYAVEAMIYKGDQMVARQSMPFATSPGGFAGTVTVAQPGTYRLVLSARNIQNGNAGVFEMRLRIRKPRELANAGI